MLYVINMFATLSSEYAYGQLYDDINTNDQMMGITDCSYSFS